MSATVHVPPVERDGHLEVTEPGRPWMEWAAAVWGSSSALIVAIGGRPPWIVLRVLVVILLTAALLLAIRRRRFVSAAALAAGTVGVVVGLGIGVSHLVRSGDVLLVVAGLASLVSGLMLFIGGASGALRRFRRPGRAAGGVALAVALGVIALTFVPAVMATNVPSTTLGEATPATYGLTYEDVDFDTADGVTLSAWYVPSDNGAAIVVRHGAGSTRSNALAQAAVLARHGFGVLLTDARGHGRSDGRAMDFGWFGDEDIAAAVTFLALRPEVDPERIGVLGLSMGGEEAIGAAAADPRVQAVVAEGATGRTEADDAWLADEYGIRGRMQGVIEWFRYSLTDILTSADRPTSLAAAIERSQDTRFLLIPGGDMPDEVAVAGRLEAVSPDRVSVWVVPGAGHTAGLSTAPEEWERRVIEFLDGALGSESS